MKIIIKAIPEDFIVHEQALLRLTQKGDYAAYRLTKRGCNTVELLSEIARSSGIALSLFSYGGRKDRHGLTTQYLSIKSPKRLALQEKNYSLEFIGLMQRPMGPDLIEANKFQITVRGLSQQAVHKAVSQLELVATFGYPNYFDDQRFGSYDPAQGFFAQKVLKKQFNGALKSYFSSIYPHEKKEDKIKKQFFITHWKQWQECAQASSTPLEKKAFARLVLKPHGFLETLGWIPREELSTRYCAFQSYLWNTMLSTLINTRIHALKTQHNGACSHYIFYTTLSPDEHEYLLRLALPTPGSKPEFPSTVARQLYFRALETQGIKNTMFNSLKLRKAFFKSFLRQALVVPQNLSWEQADDELYPGGKKLILDYTLPRGSFATMLIKRIFSLPAPYPSQTP